MPRISCPKCSSRRVWHIRRNKVRCVFCKYEWINRKLPLRLTTYQWKKILKLFMLGLNSNQITEQTGINKPRILRALTYTRKAMINDVPKQFSGIVEVDETYIGGKWINKRKLARSKGTKRGRGTSKQPVFGIYARKGVIWAEIVDDVGSSTLQPLIKKQVRKGSTVCSDTWRGYTGIATKGYVHRLVDHSKEFANKGAHINGLEGFWGYLKRRLAAKGGIRRERLHLYLAEYVWRYNHRKLSVNENVLRLIMLLNKRRFSG